MCEPVIGAQYADAMSDRPEGVVEHQIRSGDDESEQRYAGDTDGKSMSHRSSTDQTTSSSAASVEPRSAPAVINYRPHKAHDAGWEAIRSLVSRDGSLGLGHFRFIQRLGSGDIGSVYLTELRGTGCYFAMKVMDKGALKSRNKLSRAQTEREILEVLDHPFLPTLYAHIDDGQHSCLVMEFCPGGDLHVLRQRQPLKRFRDDAVRFYAAEVLLALEYLHMMGIVYRDLKPENVLVREDGHIMLSDFDLSLKCNVNPTLTRVAAVTTVEGGASPPPGGGPCPANSACMIPLGCVSPCSVHPIASCLPMPRILQMTTGSRRRRHKGRRSTGVDGTRTTASGLPELLAEPTAARSMSFVGTHEYLAPEIILGDGHGSAVDWWTFGIFLFELLYGRTPFKGSDNELTLMNVVSQLLRFPAPPSPEDDPFLRPPSPAALDLIRRLLVKDPHKRLAALRGAAEIKQHAFFAGVNWALIRCAIPPEIPSPFVAPDARSISDCSTGDTSKEWFFDGSQPDAIPDFDLF